MEIGLILKSLPFPSARLCLNNTYNPNEMRKVNLGNAMFFLFLLLVSLSDLSAQNPIPGPGLYIADPSSHVWKDGKLYIYGSRDESPAYYCSHDHYVLSTSDLIHWDVWPDAFASAGKNDQVPYSDDFLYAPDCQYKDGTYYLYYCLASPVNTEGVATSKSPVGPFMNGKVIDLGGANQIDPCVFMDDDGQAYYIWGQFSAKVAKLKPNMMEIDKSTIKDSVVTEKEHFFHEGGYMVKRNGIYYFIYAHMGRGDMPTCIGYSTSKSPMGPFKYGGVIVDNDHCDPGNWNNHGSIVEFKGKWYVLYHRATHNSVTMRKACIEPITFNADGSINEVEMTTQGAAGPLNAVNKMDAERACLMYGNVRITACAADNEALTGIRDNDRAGYKYLDFGQGVDSLSIRVAPGMDAGRIDIGLDNIWGPSIGSVSVPGDGDRKTWITLSAGINAVHGVHAIWLRFSGKGENLFSVDSFQFIRHSLKK
jgi:arabinoxylan arabinofuranohydrolase